MSTLSILSAYLPYNLTCLVDGKHATTLHAVYADGTCTFYNLVESEHGFSSIKPFLRSLKTANDYLQHERYSLFTEGKDETAEHEAQAVFQDPIFKVEDTLHHSDIPKLSYAAMQWLLSHHVDVFDILSTDEAIEICEPIA
jgi:hypothetical protein